MVDFVARSELKSVHKKCTGTYDLLGGVRCITHELVSDGWTRQTKIYAYLFFSPAGNTLGASGSRRLFLAWASASSSHACSIGFSAIILLWDSVRLSNRHIVLCDKAPTPGNFKFAKALPTSACVTPAFERRFCKGFANVKIDKPRIQHCYIELHTHTWMDRLQSQVGGR